MAQRASALGGPLDGALDLDTFTGKSSPLHPPSGAAPRCGGQEASQTFQEQSTAWAADIEPGLKPGDIL